MNRNPGKRKVDTVDLTDNDQDESSAHRPRKASRVDEPHAQLNITRGQRFGESALFIPLSQASQVSGFDEDDASATALVQNSQDFDDASYEEYKLYGMYY